jgi:hypothetical protein
MVQSTNLFQNPSRPLDLARGIDKVCPNVGLDGLHLFFVNSTWSGSDWRSQPAHALPPPHALPLPFCALVGVRVHNGEAHGQKGGRAFGGRSCRTPGASWDLIPTPGFTRQRSHSSKHSSQFPLLFQAFLLTQLEVSLVDLEPQVSIREFSLAFPAFCSSLRSDDWDQFSLPLNNRAPHDSELACLFIF